MMRGRQKGTEIMSEETMKNRELLYSGLPSEEAADQSLGKPQPSFTAKHGEHPVIALPKEQLEDVVCCNDFYRLLTDRKSSRLYEPDPLSLKELSYLLWMTQGVKEVTGVAHKVTLRNVPSAGCRHALETYLFVNRVEELMPGCYHYLPETHELELISADTDHRQTPAVSAAFNGQTFFGASAVAFVWTAVPYRMEWRFGSRAEKLILLDAGHVCQNLYLAAGSIGCGISANAAYLQDAADALLHLIETRDNEQEAEMVIYAASVGKKEPAKQPETDGR